MEKHINKLSKEFVCYLFAKYMDSNEIVFINSLFYL